MFSVGIISAAGGIGLISFTYNGATGNWSDGTKWLGGVSPGAGSTTTAAKVTSTAPTITMDVSTVLNQLQFNEPIAGTTTISTSTAKTITFDGVSPSITALSTASSIISAPIILNQNLSILGTTGAAGAIIGKLTNNAKNITVNMTGGTLIFNFPSNTGMSGGNIFLISGTIQVSGNSAIGGASGPTVTLGNNGVMPTVLFTNTGSATAFANNVIFSDTGSQIFTLQLNATSNAGTYSGSITHDLLFGQGTVDGNWSGFSTSANLIIQGLKIATTTFPTSQMVIGVATGNVVGNLSANRGLANNINVVGGATASIASVFANTSTTAVTNSGNIVLNSNQSTIAGNKLTLNGGTGAVTFSGAISNAASNAANTSIVIGAAPAIIYMTNTNTYTSPTTFVSAGAGILGVNGSISGSTTTVPGANKLSGKGTLGPVVLSTGTAALYCYSFGNTPSTSDVLTIQGNLSMTSTTSQFHTIIGAGNAASRLQVNGNVTFSAGCNCVIDAGTASGTYTIMTITGTFTGTLANPTTGTGSTVNGTLAVVGQNLVLTV